MLLVLTGQKATIYTIRLVGRPPHSTTLFRRSGGWKQILEISESLRGVARLEREE